MQIIIVSVHVLAALLLVLLILLQQGKGGGMAGLFGGGSGMDDFLASPGSDVFLKKLTVVLATVFFLTSIMLSVRTSRQASRSLLQTTPMPVPVSQSQGAGK
jgi:preprotein translocase subunit SecG